MGGGKGRHGAVMEPEEQEGEALRMSLLWNSRLRCSVVNGSLFSEEEKAVCFYYFFPFA